jgi:hypothetical protein
MSGLDILHLKGLSPSDPDSPATPVVQCAPIAPHVEDLFRWNKQSFDHQSSKEIQATVSYCPLAPSPLTKPPITVTLA